MDGQLKAGTVLTSENSNNKYKVIKMLGAGGQGEVYDVECNGQHYALKWYFKHMATKDQKTFLDTLISGGPPDASFLWPQDLIFTQFGEPLGCITPLRPQNYTSIIDLLKRRAEPSFYALCRAAYNLANGYEKLHSIGYCYLAVDFSGVFFNPETGDVLICDFDNISISGDNPRHLYGTPRFMAPECIVGKAKPSKYTDLYSLSVLLFYMLMLGHPLEGKLEADTRVIDFQAMEKLYSTDPVFVFDPNNKTNRPVRGYQDNVLIYWDLYPKTLRDLFTQSFTVGLTTPSKRVTERKWMDTFANLMCGVMPCSCGAEIFFDGSKTAMGVAHTCWNCGKAVSFPVSLVIGKNRIILQKDAKIYSHHVLGNYDMKTVVGAVVQNPKNPQLGGIRNDGAVNWTYIKPDGQQVPVPSGRSAAIAKDVKIDFGQAVGYFE